MSPEEEVTGKRSSRWTFMSRLKIGKPGVGVYLDRLRIISTPWGGVYLHHILQPDPDPDPHDHPWSFRTVVLRGWYEELLHPIPRVILEHAVPWRYRRFSSHRMGRETAHRITSVSDGGVWTLVFVGKRTDTWGFYTPQGWLPWWEYTGSTNKVDR